jgi:4-hydroxy-tetrahydrodipicolinate synthase
MGAVTAAALARPVTEPATGSGPRFHVAAITPVDRAGRFDESLARDLMAFFRKHGVDGVVVLGTTGEFSSFSVSERKKILEVMIKSRGNLEIICHITTPNLPETLELLDHAAGAGADKVLVLPPFYFKNPSLQGLEAFFTPVLEKARVPVLLYHIPGTSGVPIGHDLVRSLSRFERLYGIKDSSGNTEGLLAYIKAFPNLKILTGSGRLISLALQNGGGGAITGNGNVIPGETAALFREYRAGNELTAAQTRLNEVSRVMPWDIAEMKFALGELGLRESYCRPPFVELNAEKKAELKVRINQYKSGDHRSLSPGLG